MRKKWYISEELLIFSSLKRLPVNPGHFPPETRSCTDFATVSPKVFPKGHSPGLAPLTLGSSLHMEIREVLRGPNEVLCLP